MKAPRLRPLAQLLAPSVDFCAASQTRWLHRTRPQPPIPKPRPFVPDVQTFLTLIGRGLSKHASKFPSWDALFSLSSPQLQELGIEPPRTRRYLLQWLNKYRLGALGPGGDFEHVRDGQALLRVAMPPAQVLSNARWVVNVPLDQADAPQEQLPEKLPRPRGYLVKGFKSIVGPYAMPLPGRDGAVVKVTEGMWEDRRGHKIDGGERRRAEVRFKRRSAERRAELEAQMGR
ncbi:hypothetical protein HIM_05026 [Hirsutella minnesotensis 3608]|uniref:Small ribosomal subunit protein mS41 n=1 Tax=Hirsutella minnesotensis 3608 TaxID=1043627 RepID=A0A0F7ZUW3_9HYPO|nr:hypothetical protein HIM_05026 [Hirsutella minnesotensis 3608]